MLYYYILYFILVLFYIILLHFICLYIILHYYYITLCTGKRMRSIPFVAGNVRGERIAVLRFPEFVSDG